MVEGFYWFVCISVVCFTLVVIVNRLCAHCEYLQKLENERLKGGK